MNRGGLESLVMDIYRGIDRERIQFDFLTFREIPGYFDEEIRSLGGNVHYLSPITIKNFSAVPSRVCSFLKKHPQYKIVHAHLDQWCGIVLKGAKQANTPVRIAHSHSTYLTFNIENIIRNIIKLPVNKYATHRFAISQKAGIWLFGKKNVGNGNVTIWHNAVNCDKFRYNDDVRKKMRSELDLNDACTIVHVGNLRYPKNPLFLIDIFCDLIKKIPNSKLLSIGKDCMDGQCQRYAEQKKCIDKIMFLGMRSDVAQLLQAGDVFVFPSRWEGFPGAVLEAQAAGLPCVISDAITDEVCLTDNIAQLPINKGTDIWVNKICEFNGSAQADSYNILVQKGFDISVLSKKLSDFYENASG